MQGVITTIQRMSLHDGPGIRSTIFFKGCNFRCAWCHNPETWSREPQIQYISSRCISCHSCVDVCQNGALTLSGGQLSFNSKSHSDYEKSVVACPSGALSIVGKFTTVSQLIDHIYIDKAYYDESGGGVTISGGEPFLQFDFLKTLLVELKSLGIHTAVESNLSCKQELIEELLPYVDLWLVDLKSANDIKHKEYVLHTNADTIANIKFLSRVTKHLIVRTPVVPTFNDSDEDIVAICEILAPLNIKSYELLAFHTLGFDKFRQYNIPNHMVSVEPLAKGRFEELKKIVKNYK